jgi:hypothetical protein
MKGVRVTGAVFAAALALASSARAQDPQRPPPPPAMDPQMQMDMSDGIGWRFMQNAVAFVMLNDQGSDRGKTQVRAPNWWMGMGTRKVRAGTLTITVMLSLDPLTVGKQGYSEIFQIGETFEGNALIDHQHPHDFLMQASAVWRHPLVEGVFLTLAGGPVGEPALGPVAFMHRASAYENPIAPLSHHTLDSTHIAMGVVTTSLDRGPFQLEGSVFRGAEPDENRWNIDFGPLDSWSARGWYRPTPKWSFQFSHGFLKKPDALEDGNVRRTTASGSWKTERAGGWTAVTLAWGRNRKISGRYNALLAEATHVFASSSTTLYTRLESTQVEDDLLRTGVNEFQGGRKNAHLVQPGKIDYVGAFSLGGTHTLWKPWGWDVAAGAEATTYGVKPQLVPFYGAHPWSFQVFARVRMPSLDHMTDHTMTYGAAMSRKP